jgi:hypothetical protein
MIREFFKDCWLLILIGLVLTVVTVLCVIGIAIPLQEQRISECRQLFPENTEEQCIFIVKD